MLLGGFRPIPLPPGRKSFPALSPAGDRLAYAKDAAGEWDIWLARIGEAPVNLTERMPGQHSQPAFSPDGRRLALSVRREGPKQWLAEDTAVLTVVDLDDGTVHALGEGGEPTWSPDGSAIAVVPGAKLRQPALEQQRNGLWIVEVEGGRRREITGVGATNPAWSPGGHRIAFVSAMGGGSDVWTVSVTSRELVRVTLDDAWEWSPVWSPDGRYLYYGTHRDGRPDVWRVHLDEITGEVLGDPERVSRGFPASHFYLASARRVERLLLLHRVENFTLFALPFDPGVASALRAPSRPLVSFLIPAGFADASPDGRHLIFASTTGSGGALQSIDLEAPEPVTLFADPFPIRSPRWAPAGDRVAFEVDRDGGPEIRLLGAGRADDSEGTISLGTGTRSPVWSPDGRALAYAAGNGHAWVASTGEPRPPEPLAPFPEQGVAFEPSSWSPDGSSLAGTSGGIVVYDLEHRRYRRLTDTGERPIWVGGTHLLFVDGDRIRCVDTRRGERRDVWTVSPNRLLPEGDSSSTLRT